MKMHLLNDRSTFRIQGEDSFEFLQSVLTADINPLKENKAVASCLLSAQGRVIYDFLLYPEDNDVIQHHPPQYHQTEIELPCNDHAHRGSQVLETEPVPVPTMSDVKVEPEDISVCNDESTSDL